MSADEEPGKKEHPTFNLKPIYIVKVLLKPKRCFKLDYCYYLKCKVSEFDKLRKSTNCNPYSICIKKGNVVELKIDISQILVNRICNLQKYLPTQEREKKIH